jgi:hypothetical protein
MSTEILLFIIFPPKSSIYLDYAEIIEFPVQRINEIAFILASTSGNEI